ncbi:MAG TPA: hypothetical protein V6D47_13950 [Oscillatoriaceae cyanobacterium]
MPHPVGFTDTAKQDLREFLADAPKRTAPARGIIAKLAIFPRAHMTCPRHRPAHLAIARQARL